MRQMSGKEVRKILEQSGFVLVRQRGSHMIMQRKDGDTTTTVPIPDHKELKKGTLRSIIRQSGIPKNKFD